MTKTAKSRHIREPTKSNAVRTDNRPRRMPKVGDKFIVDTIGLIGNYGEPTGAHKKASALHRTVAVVYTDSSMSIKDSAGEAWRVYWNHEEHAWMPHRNQVSV